MEYEKLYNTVNEYNEAEGTGDVTSTTPGNGYIVENDAVKYNVNWDVVKLVFDVQDISVPTKVYHSQYFKTGLKRVVVDGKVVKVADYATTYQFDEVGKHIVHLFYENKTTVYGYEYADCTELIYANFPKSVVEVEDAGLSGCTNLYSIVFNYPGKVTLKETALSMQRQIWTRSFDQKANHIRELKVDGEYVADYRASCGTTYGALYIMPLNKTITNIEWGKLEFNQRLKSDGTTIPYSVTVPDPDHEEYNVLPALTDYIEIPASTSAISYSSGNVNYYTPPGDGGWTRWYLVAYDENKQIVGYEECFSVSHQEVVPYVLPAGTKYVRFDMLWQSLDPVTLEPYDKWPRYAHIKDANTQEIIWPKVTYA